jgi:uncharacterized membrane protein YjjP (DUF1212 family)
MGALILLAALACAVYGFASGNGQFIWFAALLVLYTIGSSFALSLEDTARHKRASVAIVSWLQLGAIALGIYGLISSNGQFVVYGVVILVIVVGITLVLSVRDARRLNAQQLQELGLTPDREK